jgi:UDP-N-acetylmuramoylalanine--D-glutamate ligase
MMELSQKNIVVVGMGVTGVAVARFLKKRGAEVIVNDLASEGDLGHRVRELHAMGISVELGRHPSETFEKADLIVLSPGVSHTIEPAVKARKRGTPVIGEIELASRFIRQPILAVTGTNGKTTTTELLGDMLKRSGFGVFVGGNIGTPLIEYAEGKQAAQYIVAEISSFQLDTIETFRPHVGVMLNITNDHLDRYPDFAAYAASKFRLFENQQAEDIAVLNGSDPVIRSHAQHLKSRKLVYPDPLAGEKGAFLNNRYIKLNPETEYRNPTALDISNIKLPGRHNLENACAASLAAMAVGAQPEAIQETLNQFQGSTHRMEYFETIEKVDFYNDSKATNVDAVIRAVECFSSPVVLVMGGLDKGGDFDRLKEVVSRHVKKLIVMGRAADLIRTSLEEATPTETVNSMADAARQAYRASSAGDVVLLSPGCASFDMYDNYAQRGDDFKESVKRLKREKPA